MEAWQVGDGSIRLKFLDPDVKADLDWQAIGQFVTAPLHFLHFRHAALGEHDM